MRRYAVTVTGYETYFTMADTSSKARAKAYRAFTEAYDISFRDFLDKVHVQALGAKLEGGTDE